MPRFATAVCPRQHRTGASPSRRTAISLLFLLAAAFFTSLPAAFPQSNPPSESFETLTKRAAAARDSDQLDQAIVLYEKALAIRPKWAEGWWSLGTIEYDRNNYRSAAAAFRQLIPLAPKDGTAYAMLGLCEFELGQDDAALKYLEQAKTLNISSNEQLRRVLLYHDGLLLLRVGRFQSAQTVLGGLCQDTVPNADAIKALGWAVFRIDPKTAPPQSSPGTLIVQRAGHAECLAIQKKYDEARQEYSTLAAEYPEYPNIHYVFGKFLAEANDPTAAVAEFQKEIKNNPKDINSRLEIAATQYKVNSAAGIPYAEQAVQLDPRLPFAHYLLGLLYLDVDEYQKAIPHLEIAQKAFPKDAKICFALGSAYSRAGRKQEAAKARNAFQRLNQESTNDSNASY